jgi:hypothetical protein
MRAVTGGMGRAGSHSKPSQVGGGDQGGFGGGDQGPFGGNGDQGPFGGNGDQGPFGGNGDQGPFGGNGDQGPFGGNGDQGPFGGKGQGGGPPQTQAAVPSNVIAKRKLNFKIEIQEQSEWCWAAVAASINKYFDPASTLQQCDVANKVLPKDYPGQDLPDSDCPCCCHCCCEPEKCDKPAQLEVALQQVHKFRKILLRPLTFEEIQREIDAGRPIGVAITWESGNSPEPNSRNPNPPGHFVVLRGYRELTSGLRQVYVGDPLNPSSLVDVDEFTLAYYGDGVWTASYLVHSGRA